jgi:hypothetical protein
LIVNEIAGLQKKSADDFARCEIFWIQRGASASLQPQQIPRRQKKKPSGLKEGFSLVHQTGTKFQPSRFVHITRGPLLAKGAHIRIQAVA